MHEALVSIVIPTFNRSKSLKRAVDSVLKQTYAHWELIIVDNSSTDDTLSILSSYLNKNIRVINVTNDGVIGYSRNIGVAQSNGKYIAFLDSDDWWEKSKLENAVDTIIKNNSDIVYHNCQYVSERSKSFSNSRILKEDVLRDLIINGNTLITSSTLMLKKSLIKAGCFSEKLQYIGWEDYHLWLKFAQMSFKFSMIKGYHGYCWQGSDNFDNPKRILLNLIQIEKFFIKEYSQIMKENRVWWLNYTRGKAYAQTQNTLEAKKALNYVLLNTSPLEYKLKSLYYRFFYNLRNLIRKNQ